jgi:hypothetical protein
MSGPAPCRVRCPAELTALREAACVQEAVNALFMENQQQSEALKEGAAVADELRCQNACLRDDASAHEASTAELTLALEVTKQQQGANFSP